MPLQCTLLFNVLGVIIGVVMLFSIPFRKLGIDVLAVSLAILTCQGAVFALWWFYAESIRP